MNEIENGSLLWGRVRLDGNQYKEIIVDREDEVSLLAVSPDGSMVSTGGGHKVKLWDLHTGSLLRTMDVFMGTSVAFSPDGSLLAISKIGGIELRHVQSGELLNTIQEFLTAATEKPLDLLNPMFNSIAFSRENLLAGVDCGAGPQPRESFVSVWRIKLSTVT